MQSQKYCISKRSAITYSFIIIFFLTLIAISNLVSGGKKIYNSQAAEETSNTPNIQQEQVDSNSQLAKPITSGTINAYNIIVEFSNKPNTETIQSLQTKYVSVNSYYLFATYAKLKVAPKIIKTVALNESIIKGTHTDCNNSSYVKEWMVNIKKETYDKDPDKRFYNAIIFNFPWDDTCSPAYSIDLTTPGLLDHIYINGGQNYMAYAHEIAHYTGLGHANFLYCMGKIVPENSSACTIKYTDDPFNIMARFNPGHFNGLMKSQNGWLNSKIFSVNKYFWQSKVEKEITLYALETSTQNTQVIKISKSDKLFGDSYYIEYRFPILFDDTIPLPASGGVLIYMNNLQEGAKKDTLLMDVHATSAPYGYDTLKSARLIQGEFFDDTKNKIKISVLSIDATAKNAKIKVELY